MRGPMAFAAAMALAACGISVVGVEPDAIELVDGGATIDAAKADAPVADATPDAAEPPKDATIELDASPCGGACIGFCVENTCKTPIFWVRGDDAVEGATFTWPDRSGVGNDALQATAGLQPTIVTENGHKLVHFANNARLVVTNVSAFQPGTGDIVWFHVARNAGSNAVDKNQVFGTLKDIDPYSGITAGYDQTNHPYGMFRSNADVFIKATGTSTVGDLAVTDMRRTGGNAELRRNGTSIATGAANMNVNGGQIVVGAERATGTEFLNGDIAEIVLFATPFTDAERNALAKQLGALYGIAVAP